MTWHITDDFNSIPRGADIEMLSNLTGETVAWRWCMPEQVEQLAYVTTGQRGFSMFPAHLSGNPPHCPMRISFPSLGGRIVPGVYTSEAGHVVTVEDGKP